VRWGLIPSWCRNPAELALLFNARAETAQDRPAFRGGLRHRRCLVPGDGFYAWSGPKRHRVPHLLQRRGGGLLAFGAIAEHWLGADGSEMETMAILTVAANRFVSHVQDRMPLILNEESFERWLDCRAGSATSIGDLLVPAPDDLLECRVLDRGLGTLINDPPTGHAPSHPGPRR
jgi:putative SOS response-associated peptidase YedK